MSKDGLSLAQRSLIGLGEGESLCHILVKEPDNKQIHSSPSLSMGDTFQDP